MSKVRISNADLDEEVQVEDSTSVIAKDLTETLTGTETTKKQQSHDSINPVNTYQIKPNLHDKFKANPVKEVIHNVLTDTLSGKVYDSVNAKKWTINIANQINEKVRELEMKRYKHVVQVTIGELKGAGVKSGVRCLWDSETDGYTSDIFMNFSGKYNKALLMNFCDHWLALSGRHMIEDLEGIFI